MIKKRTKAGNSVAAVLDRETLKQAQLAGENEVRVSVEIADEDFEQSIDFVDEHYDRALRRLAQ